MQGANSPRLQQLAHDALRLRQTLFQQHHGASLLAKCHSIGATGYSASDNDNV